MIHFIFFPAFLLFAMACQPEEVVEEMTYPAKGGGANLR